MLALFFHLFLAGGLAAAAAFATFMIALALDGFFFGRATAFGEVLDRSKP